MNRIEITGVLNDEVKTNQVGNTQVAETDLHFEVPGKDGPRKAWVEIQMWGSEASELQALGDSGVGLEVKVTGSLNRRAWKDKNTDEWISKHSITVEEITEVGNAVAPELDEDIPFK